MEFLLEILTEEMLPPFQEYMDTALTHYMIQLPFISCTSITYILYLVMFNHQANHYGI